MKEIIRAVELKFLQTCNHVACKDGLSGGRLCADPITARTVVYLVAERIFEHIAPLLKIFSEINPFASSLDSNVQVVVWFLIYIEIRLHYLHLCPGSFALGYTTDSQKFLDGSCE